MNPSARDRARKIKIVLFDVDGVLTDGGIWLFPTPAPAGGSVLEEIRARDGEAGFGIHSTSMVRPKASTRTTVVDLSARLGGMKCGIVTKRISETVALRARDLKLEFVYQGAAFKMQPIREIVEKEGVSLDEICYVGDDVIDPAGHAQRRLRGGRGQCAAAGEGGSALCDGARGRAWRRARRRRVHS